MGLAWQEINSILEPWTRKTQLSTVIFRETYSSKNEQALIGLTSTDLST